MPHTNHNVGSARPEITTFPLHSKIEKSEDHRRRTYLQVTEKNEATEAWKALRRVLRKVSRGHRIWLGFDKPTEGFQG